MEMDNMSNSENFKRHDEDTELLWLALDEEGLEYLRMLKGDKFIEQHKEFIFQEKQKEMKISQNLIDKETCPEELICRIKKQIYQNKKQNFMKIISNYLSIFPVFGRKKIIWGTVCILIFCCSLSFIHFKNYLLTLPYKNQTEQIALIQQKEFDKKNKIEENFNNIVFASTEENISSSDYNSIQELLKNKTQSIAININEIMNPSSNYQLIGYREDSIDDSFIIQIIFQNQDSKLKVIVSPCTSKNIDMYKPAILQGKVRDIRIVNNHLVCLVGEPEISTQILNFFDSIPNLSNINTNNVTPNETNSQDINNIQTTENPDNNTLIPSNNLEKEFSNEATQSENFSPETQEETNSSENTPI